MNSILRRLNNLLFAFRGKGRIGNLLAGIVSSLKWILTLGKDPLISHRIGSSVLLLPWAHDLPFNIRYYPNYSFNVARLAKYSLSKYPHLTAIDIGANVGDTVAIMRSEASYPILSIEGNDKFLPLLEINTRALDGVEIEKSFVGDRDEKIEGSVVNYMGSGRVSKAEKGADLISFKKLSTILAEHPNFSEFKFLKIDTDGFDNSIILGAMDVIRRNKPIIFFEYDPCFLQQQGANGIDLFQIIAGWGYKKMLVYENNGDFMVSANLEDVSLIQEINDYFSGRDNQKYCDLCVFHAEDIELFDQIRRNEMSFFRKFRRF